MSLSTSTTGESRSAVEGGLRSGGQRSEYHRQFSWKKSAAAASPILTAQQVEELRQQAMSYRRQAWGSNFCRDHLSQLLSNHNALWEAASSCSYPPSPHPHSLTSDPRHLWRLWSSTGETSESIMGNLLYLLMSKCVFVCSNSSQRSSASGRTKTPERRSVWGEEEETDEEEGRLPTPRLKIRPTQRTHHDLTTPATGGAILVGKMKSGDESSTNKQRCGSSVPMAAGAETTVAMPITPKEAWSEHNSAHSKTSTSSPNNKPTVSPASKPIRTKQTSPPPVAPPPQHCIQGTLRTADFQHNGEERPFVGDVVAFGDFLLGGVRRPAASSETREFLGKEMTSDL
ncbi:hypothetical protein F7725_022094 [Dissostichus mawsoni]|uniref:Nuclear protein MDM1 n=1 Tax=Dissostichus mawsoni TaxID=36200 RepID=A0A7J5ZCZ5_DISMA|nr:hypothetical protein F7725_022094 [Dissostichus mawsoni]